MLIIPRTSINLQLHINTWLLGTLLTCLFFHSRSQQLWSKTIWNQSALVLPPQPSSQMISYLNPSPILSYPCLQLRPNTPMSSTNTCSQLWSLSLSSLMKQSWANMTQTRLCAWVGKADSGTVSSAWQSLPRWIQKGNLRFSVHATLWEQRVLQW